MHASACAEGPGCPTPDRAVRLSCDPVRKGGQLRVDPAETPEDRRARCDFALAFSDANVRRVWETGSGRLALGRLIGALKGGPHARRDPLTKLRSRKGFLCAVHPVG